MAYTKSEKERIVQLRKDNASWADIARAVGKNVSTVRNWYSKNRSNLESPKACRVVKVLRRPLISVRNIGVSKYRLKNAPEAPGQNHRPMMMNKQLPLEIIIIIIQKLDLYKSAALCQALSISDELAFQYHKYDPGLSYLSYLPNEDNLWNRDLAKALLKNKEVQSFALANEKIWFAVVTQDMDLVKSALEDPKVDHDNICTSPLHSACKFGSLDVVKLLVDEYGIDISAHRNAALYTACQYGRYEIVSYIITYLGFVDKHECSRVLDPAAERGRCNILQLLLADDRFDPSFGNNQAIISAAQMGKEEAVKLLLADPRVNPIDQNNRAIKEAAKLYQENTIKILLSDPRVAKACKKEKMKGLVERIKSMGIRFK